MINVITLWAEDSQTRPKDNVNNEDNSADNIDNYIENDDNNDYNNDQSIDYDYANRDNNAKRVYSTGTDDKNVYYDAYNA